jgi:hypothetical protein
MMRGCKYWPNVGVAVCIALISHGLPSQHRFRLLEQWLDIQEKRAGLGEF